VFDGGGGGGGGAVLPLVGILGIFGFPPSGFWRGGLADGSSSSSLSNIAPYYAAPPPKAG